MLGKGALEHAVLLHDDVLQIERRLDVHDVDVLWKS